MCLYIIYIDEINVEMWLKLSIKQSKFDLPDV